MRNLVIFDPWKELESFSNDVSRLFDSGFENLGKKNADYGTTWAPSVNIHEDENSYNVEADIPGVNKDDLNVDVDNNILTIKAERKSKDKIEKENYIRAESVYGTFARRLTIPETVDLTNIKAEYKDGVLKLTLPKKEESKPKKISIDVN